MLRHSHLEGGWKLGHLGTGKIRKEINALTPLYVYISDWASELCKHLAFFITGGKEKQWKCKKKPKVLHPGKKTTICSYSIFHIYLTKKKHKDKSIVFFGIDYNNKICIKMTYMFSLNNILSRRQTGKRGWNLDDQSFNI